MGSDASGHCERGRGNGSPRSSALCRALVTSALLLGLLALAAEARAARHDLYGHGTLKLKGADGARSLRTSLRRHRVPMTSLRVDCPTEIALRVATESNVSPEMPLPCEGWRRGKRGRLEFRDARRGLRLRLATNALKLKLRDRSLPSTRGLRGAVELELRFGRERWCGRLEGVARRSQQVRARGAVRPCRILRAGPNILLVNLDDARADGIDEMPTALSRIADEGATFERAYVSNAVCASSRASLLTGLYTRNHGLRQLHGGVTSGHMRWSGLDRRTVAVWLQAEGYRTGLFGKYINSYRMRTEAGMGPTDGVYVPPGWDRWWAVISTAHYGGVHGDSYDVVDENGGVQRFEDHESDAEYSTDLSAAELRRFIAEAHEQGRPFFAYWTPYAPHVEVPSFQPQPAERHFGAFDQLPPWRPPNYDEEDVSDKPRWIAALRRNRRYQTDIMRRRGYETLLSVDEQLGKILDQLEDLGIEEETAVILTSDNGVGWGEHRVYAMGKGCPYEECLRVPLLIRYPAAIEAGARIDATAALNIDLTATLVDWAGIEAPEPIDGISLRPWLEGRPGAAPRRDFLVEYWQHLLSDSLRLSGTPRDGDCFRLFYGNPAARPRASTLFEFDSGNGVDQEAVPVAIQGSTTGSLARLAATAVLRVPHLEAMVRDEVLTLQDQSRELHGLLWWEEVDAGGVAQPRNPRPNYVGVRDVADDYLWVEYETGERELYDLRQDPHQLTNVADDPDYSAVRSRLEARLQRLLDGS